MITQKGISEEIINLRNQALGEIMQTASKNDLEEIKIKYLGRSGLINELIKDIKNLSQPIRKQIGITINDTKSIIQNEINEAESKINKQENNFFDPTIPGIKPLYGSTHIITKAILEIEDIFKRLGYTRRRYPEIEWDWQAFTSLNFHESHPARDEWETFFIDKNPSRKYGPMLLTPHTSSGQVREMEQTKPPIRMINIAKTYRRQSDVSHYPMFHQFEGLFVDENASIANLKGTLDFFVHNFFGEERKTRIRPYNFPFTEPSFEVDISCGVCAGRGCKLCKEGWLEIGGAGMVHPNVLKNGGLNPSQFKGFAFGWGVERVYMMKPGVGIDDLRTLYSGDLRYLRQF